MARLGSLVTGCPQTTTILHPLVESHAMTAQSSIIVRYPLLMALAILPALSSPVLAVDAAPAKTLVAVAAPKLNADDCALSPEDAKKADEWKAMTPQQREARRAERKAEYQKMSPEQKADVRAKMEKRKQCRMQRQSRLQGQSQGKNQRQAPVTVPAATTPAATTPAAK